MPKLLVHWVGTKPIDAPDWERIINERADEAIGFGSVRIRNVGGSQWWIEAARIGHVSLGMGGMPQPPGPPLDYRSHLTRGLREAGKQVIGREEYNGPMTAEELRALRSAVEELYLSHLDPQPHEAGFDFQPIKDLLTELDRPRGNGDGTAK